MKLSDPAARGSGRRWEGRGGEEEEERQGGKERGGKGEVEGEDE